MDGPLSMKRNNTTQKPVTYQIGSHYVLVEWTGRQDRWWDWSFILLRGLEGVLYHVYDT